MMRGRTSGFTLVEVCIALALLVVLFVKLTMILNQATDIHRRQSVAMALEEQSQMVMDRIVFAVLGSDADRLFPDPSAPFFSERLEFEVSLGVEDGEVVWGDPEVIGLDEDPAHLYWGRNEGTATEQLVVWCRTVADLYEAEIPNGIDDNDNDLTDEGGLSFVLSGETITIRLTLEREAKEGPVRYTNVAKVACRN